LRASPEHKLRAGVCCSVAHGLFDQCPFGLFPSTRDIHRRLSFSCSAAKETLLSQALVVSIPRNFRVDISVRGDELKKDHLMKIKSQFSRWIEGLEEAFED
jgi:hypothetical protein